MFQLLKEPNLAFMTWARPVLALSAILVLASIGILTVNGLNYGIEFTGGTELQLRYKDAPDLGDIRSRLASAGFAGSSVTSIGDPEDHEIYIRLADQGADGEEIKDPTSKVVRALRNEDEAERDLNVMDQTTLSRILAGAPGVGDANAIAAEVLKLRKEGLVFHDAQELSSVPGMTPEVVDYIAQTTVAGPFSLRSQSYIGPAIGRELKRQAGLAILGSLIGMLIYIWIRFQLQWGVAAVIALAHDTVITLGLFSIFGKEMSLPVVAAFLTLVGYSVNDTVVVFDRIRENIAKMPGTDFAKVIDASINQTLSRTVITSGLTFVVVLALLLFGGSALNPFAFVLTVGVIVGTYSSIFVASPLLVLGRRLFGKQSAQAQTAGGERRARKVRAPRAS